MIRGRRVLALIPARSGSKGLENKNIRELNGRPLLGWPIQAANKSAYVDTVIVSTDCEKYKDIALEQGAENVLMRPLELATDKARSVDVIVHVIQEMLLLGEEYDLITLLEPTSPLTTASDIDLALETITNHNTANSIVAVMKAECNHPQFAYLKDNKGVLNHFTEGLDKVIRRQDLSSVFYLDGSLYISTVASIIKEKSFLTKNTIGFEVPKWKSFEIDDEIDFDIVEMLMKRYKIEKL
jgi:N-acylneuraminate cytidylyltransferase/CMP-N,N'-diacetyllegionaminic acid synthase